jgi:hypothetical protein
MTKAGMATLSVHVPALGRETCVEGTRERKNRREVGSLNWTSNIEPN